MQRGKIFDMRLFDEPMANKVWDGITYLYPNFNGATVEVWEWIGNFFHIF